MRNQWFWGVPERKTRILAKKYAFSLKSRNIAEFSRFCWKWAKIALFSKKAPQKPSKRHTIYCRFRTRARQAGFFTQNSLFYEKSAFWWDFSEFLGKSWFLVPFCTFCAFPRPFARKAAIVMLFHRYFRWIIGGKCDLSSGINFFIEIMQFWRIFSFPTKKSLFCSESAFCLKSIQNTYGIVLL